MTAPVSTLRGGGVAIDGAKVLRAVVALCVAGLAVTAALLFVAGADKNAQISDLKADGAPVTVTVSHCLGLLGGSGSNAASYSCQGTFELSGHRYAVIIPGSSFHRPGSTVAAVAAKDDPGLLELASTLRAESPSAGVYVVPAILSGLLVAALGLVLVLRRKPRIGLSPTGASAATA